MMNRIALTLVGAAAFVAAGCGSESSVMTDPTAPGGAPAASSTFMSVNPGGGSMGVPVGTPMEFHWGVAMGTGHAGTGWGMMGGGWRHSNGAYGMAFTFTTA